MSHVEYNFLQGQNNFLHAEPEIQGIMLAGGVLQDATLAKQTAASMRAVFAPKVGTSHAVNRLCCQVKL